MESHEETRTCGPVRVRVSIDVEVEPKPPRIARFFWKIGPPREQQRKE